MDNGLTFIAPHENLVRNAPMHVSLCFR